jgi:predicted patatin/cPLA2 family phospholipase
MGLPLLTGRPVELSGVSLVDGGVMDPLPVARAIRDGHDRVTLVLNRPEKERQAEARAAAWVLGRRHPELARLALVHHRLVMDAVRLAEDPPEGVEVTIVRPSKPTGLSRFTKDVKQLRGVIESARQETHRVIAARDA